MPKYRFIRPGESDPASDRRNDYRVVGLILGLLMVLFVGLAVWKGRAPDDLGSEITYCRESYRQARSLADTAAVDIAHPPFSSGKGGPQGFQAVTCGVLRSRHETD